jgi:hypothetical protein
MPLQTWPRLASSHLLMFADYVTINSEQKHPSTSHSVRSMSIVAREYCRRVRRSLKVSRDVMSICVKASADFPSARIFARSCGGRLKIFLHLSTQAVQSSEPRLEGQHCKSTLAIQCVLWERSLMEHDLAADCESSLRLALHTLVTCIRVASIESAFCQEDARCARA